MIFKTHFHIHLEILLQQQQFSVWSVMQNTLLTKIKDWTFMCLLSGLLFGPDGY